MARHESERWPGIAGIRTRHRTSARRPVLRARQDSVGAAFVAHSGPMAALGDAVSAGPGWVANERSAAEDGEGLGGGEDADVAEGTEIEQIAIAGDDDGGLGGERAGEDLIVVRIARDAR